MTPGIPKNSLVHLFSVTLILGMLEKHIYQCAEGVSVIFEGVKTFWKTGAHVDVVIAEHKKQNCLEFIVYDAKLGLEAPRLYLNAHLAADKIEAAEYQDILSHRQETLNRAKKNFDHAKLARDVKNEMIAHHILSRLHIPSGPAGTFTVVLTPFSDDALNKDGQLDFEIAKPKTIEPLHVEFHKNATSNEIRAKFHDLQLQEHSVHQATRFAEIIVASADGFQRALADRQLMTTRYSVPRLRWIKAINLVLIQNMKAKFKARLDRMEQLEKERAKEASLAKLALARRLMKGSATEGDHWLPPLSHHAAFGRTTTVAGPDHAGSHPRLPHAPGGEHSDGAVSHKASTDPAHDNHSHKSHHLHSHGSEAHASSKDHGGVHLPKL